MLLYVGQALQAQVLPNAGQLEQEFKHELPVTPEKPSFDLPLPSPNTSGFSDDSVRIHINQLRFEGNHSIATPVLNLQLADVLGQTLTLTELQAAVFRLQDFYQQQGFVLAKVYLPAQEIDQGVVTIAVLEGHYGKITLENQSRVKTWVLARTLNTLQPGQAVQALPLQHSLLSLQDIPGVRINSLLQAGETVGTSDLKLIAQPGPWVQGYADADNHGNRYSGTYRLGTRVNINSPLGLGDQIGLRLSASNGQQRFGHVSYQVPFGAAQTQVGVSYSHLRYRLQKEFADLDAHGRASTTSAYVIHPWVRSRDFSLHSSVRYEDKRLQDDIDAFHESNTKRLRNWLVGVAAQRYDSFYGGGSTHLNLTWTHGRLTLEDPLVAWIDKWTTRSQGSFNKLTADVQRLQRLSTRWSLHAQWSAQWANRNLDSAEKFYLGGAYGVRAYTAGEASGDTGWLGRLELRYRLTPHWQLMGFGDYGKVRLHKTPWAHFDNQRRLSAAGLGVQYQTQHWQVSSYAAWKLDSAEPVSDKNRSPRFWVQAAYYF